MKDIQVITGCMFAGKTTELINRLKKSNKNYLLIKPKIDNRDNGNQIRTHGGLSEKAKRVDKISEVFEKLIDIQLIGIDEAQFFKNSIIQDIRYLISKNIQVIIAGLEKDYLDKPFGYMEEIIGISNSITRLKAACNRCQNPATYSHRKDTSFKKQLLIGNSNIYEALCEKCFTQNQ